MTVKKSPPQRTRKTIKKSSDAPVTVWSSVKVTLQLAPYESISFEHGQSRSAKNETQTEINRVENEIHQVCEAVINRRMKKYARLIRQLKEE